MGWDVARCEITTNPCGTDTRPVGHPCECGPCRGYEAGYLDGVAEATVREVRDDKTTQARLGRAVKHMQDDINECFCKENVEKPCQACLTTARILGALGAPMKRTKA